MIPKFKIWNSAGDSLLYTFTYAQSTNLPQSAKKVVEIESQRGKGSIIIDGGENSWDLVIKFLISGDDYEDVTAKIVALESAIALNTPYILKVNKTSSTYFEYNVKRISPIVYTEGLRNSILECSITFRANSW